MIVEIFSAENAVIKHIKQLSRRKYRDKHKEYMIEGVRILCDALENRQRIKYAVFCDALYRAAGGENLLKQLAEQGVKVYHTTEKLYGEIAETESPQGIMAILPRIEMCLEQLPKKKNSFYVLLDRIQDPGNLGTIIRTADSAGVDAILLTKGCVDLYNPKTIRATMGSIFHLPIFMLEDSQEGISFLKNNQIKILTTSLDAVSYHYEVDYRQDVVIVVGNEANGVSSTWMDAADALVKIPIPGKAESLNVSVAASIVLYEAVRQRMR
ncbi:TrmH family RNA methyltransferase [Geosporobacter ferrireducens]|uniref:TrmH family RNA methyltransferase n=1 Tax=Geosporobacter ferrireducens TaxID=1424294 RepID=UPI0009F4C4B1|nr:RNA methyltransferase [Geosporobacter ferrireducens]MTI56466.1 RNA methyltransferase [Geosporobacter ferrireducens]